MYGLKDFRKASKLLFRSLYTEASIGRTIAGNKAKKRRKALGNPEKLEVWYGKLVLFELILE